MLVFALGGSIYESRPFSPRALEKVLAQIGYKNISDLYYVSFAITLSYLLHIIFYAKTDYTK